MMWHCHEVAGWWMIFGGVLTVLFWGFIIALFIWGIKRLTERDEPSPRRVEKPDPLEVAKVRYARGEISKEEFEQIKRDLS